MELFNVGKQCARPDCKQLDYLPYHCHLCLHDYCAEHKQFNHHIDCTAPPSATPSRCPQCHEIVNGTSPYHSSQENANLIAAHVQGGCKTVEQEVQAKKLGKRCGVKNCRREHVVGCNGCGVKFCTGHRLREGHGCGGGVGNGIPVSVRSGGSGRNGVVFGAREGNGKQVQVQ